MRTSSLALTLALLLGACSTVADVADGVDTAVDTVSGAVTDAAGTAYRSTRDLFNGDDDAAGGAMAGALVRPTTASGARAQGAVRFRESDGGLMVTVSLRGLDPGMHGVHIHENADCGPADTDGDGTMEPAGAAGGHWDPLGTGEHGEPGDDLDDKHLGDLGNVTAKADGTAEATLAIGNYDPNARSVVGHAVIIHSGMDDGETDPGGESGRRMGCGIIEARSL